MKTAITIAILFGSGVIAADPEPAVENTTPGFHCKVGRDATRIRFLSEVDATVFDIHCEFGIDKATIRRQANEWPKKIVVRLHLRGLESFKVSRKDVAVEWSASSTNQGDQRTSLWTGKHELAIAKGNPYYSEVRRIAAGKKPSDKAGHFEIPLPAKLFDSNPEEITLQWIDFYRN